MRIVLKTFFGDFILDLDGDGGNIYSELHDTNDPIETSDAINAIESMILAHAVAGVDVTVDAYIEGIETAIEAVLNHISS